MRFVNKKGFPFNFLTNQVFLTLTAVLLLILGSNKSAHVIFAGLSFYTAGLITPVDIAKGSDTGTKKGLFGVCIHQRHDFLNRLQVLHTMIQLGKYEDALAYIDSVKKQDKTFNEICNNLCDNSLKCYLLETYFHLKQKNIKMTVKIFKANPNFFYRAYLKRKIGKHVAEYDKIQQRGDVKIVSNVLQIEMTGSSKD